MMEKMRKDVFYDKNVDMKDENIYLDFGKEIVKLLFLEDKVRVVCEEEVEPFKKYRFKKNRNIKFQVIFNVIRILGLGMEKGEEGKLQVGFAHDTIKNHFVVRMIRDEWIVGKNESLGKRLILEDKN